MLNEEIKHSNTLRDVSIRESSQNLENYLIK